MDKFLKVILLPIVRHSLNAVCVWLIGRGLTDQAGAAQIQGLTETITGILLVASNLAWSMIEKNTIHKQLSDQSSGIPPK
jgi:hypothetical protein